MSMRRSIFTLSFFIINLTSLAQQEPLFSQFWNAKTYYNPAITGLNYKHLITTIGRWQWVGVDGAPVTQLLGYATNIKKLKGGLGFTYMHETIGSSELNKTKFNYSYQIKTKKEGILSFGLAAGFNNYSFDGDWVPPTTGTDPALPQSFNETGFTGDLGISYSSKKMNLSLSATQLTASRIGGYKESTHVVLMTDYILGNENGFQLKPQAFVMTDLVKTVADLNLLILWKGKIGAGVTYRTSEDLSFSVNYDLLKKFRFGYAYDLNLGILGSISKGSHTGFFGLVFNEGKRRAKKK
jgi:type IX secretion system PorP/SprF family membrane protein